MSPLFKLCLILLLSLLCIWLFCFHWLDSVPVQSILLLALGTLAFLCLPVRNLLSELRMLIPLGISLFVVYAIFSLFQIGNSRTYWISFGITRSCLLFSSLAYMRIIFHILPMDELLDLPFTIHVMKYIILGHLLYQAAVGSYDEIVAQLEYFPSSQFRSHSFGAALRQRLVALLALMGFLMHLSTVKGEKIDEMIAYCHQKETP